MWSEVCVIGSGPRGLSVLERLTASAGRLRARGARLRVHLVDPRPGSGHVWRSDQSEQLLMNTVTSQVTLFTDDSVQMTGPVVPGPSSTRGPRTPAPGPDSRPATQARAPTAIPPGPCSAATCNGCCAASCGAARRRSSPTPRGPSASTTSPTAASGYAWTTGPCWAAWTPWSWPRATCRSPRLPARRHWRPSPATGVCSTSRPGTRPTPSSTESNRGRTSSCAVSA